ncbi:MAG: imelysin family protein [Leeuwenhoekiella sp.]
MKKSIFILGLAITLQASLISCSDNDAVTEETDTSATLYAEVLSDVSLSVITETYSDLYTNSVSLTVAVKALTVGDEEALQTVKDAWQATRAPWEKTEGFLYGPVDTEGIDPAIDSWPVDVNAINNILSSTSDINSSLLESNNEARGFHTIEYFVWGLNGNKTAAELTDREIEYLTATAENLEEKTEELYMGWAAEGSFFASNFINAGESGSIYTSQKGALQEIAEGLAIIADEVANGKIETPLNGNNGGAKPEAEESRFSNNSKLDFANNIRSIQNIYLGDYDGQAGMGLTNIVVESNVELDTNIKVALTAAITSIEAIPGTFTSAIENDRAAVADAQTKVTELLTLLQSGLVPFISNL